MAATRYRIRLYDDGSEVHTDREYAQVFDLQSPDGLREAEARLNELVLSLAQADGARGDRVSSYYLAVEDWESGTREMDWPARQPAVQDY